MRSRAAYFGGIGNLAIAKRVRGLAQFKRHEDDECRILY